MLSVLFEGITVDQDIVDKRCAENIQKIKESVVNEVLESGGGIAEAKGHDFVLVMTKSGSESRFSIVSFRYSD